MFCEVKVAFSRAWCAQNNKYEYRSQTTCPVERRTFIKRSFQRAVLMMCDKAEPVEQVPAGYICGLVGIDNYLIKTGTITIFVDAHNLKVMKFSVSLVVRVAVQPVYTVDMPKFIEGFRLLSKSNPVVQCLEGDAGELYLEICLNDLENEHTRVPIKKFEPIVSYRESVGAESSQLCLAKSTNGHNRVSMKARQTPGDLADQIERGEIGSGNDVKARAKILADTYDFDSAVVRKVWCFDPDITKPNMLIDCTKSVQYLQEIKASMVADFNWTTHEGPLCEENLCSAIFELHDIKAHQDAKHRGGASMISADISTLVFQAINHSGDTPQCACVCADNTAVSTRISIPTVGCIGGLLNQRRGHIIDQTVDNRSIYNVKGYLPVSEFFGFNGTLRGATGGQAFLQCVFDHWEVIQGDPLDPTSNAGQIVAEVRRRKGLRPEIPPLTTYFNRV